MLSHLQLQEIREHLEKAQNPVFFFDNDVDGLMSFILLRRYIGRGKGVAIKSFPELDETYLKRVEEFNSDYVFILDKPNVSNSFLIQVERKNLPVVWIDHHDVDVSLNWKNVSYYNPILSKKKSSEPTSYIAYKVVNDKKDMWIAMAGCIGDNFIPEFSQDFSRQYPDLWRKNSDSAFEILYESEFGKLITILDFSLKDTTTNVVSMINFLFSAKSPSDILIESEKNSRILMRYSQVDKIYKNLVEKAKKVSRSSKKVVFFHYGGELSISADIANELSYRFPSKIIIVAHDKGSVANISIRGKIDIRKITLEVVKKIPSATGGGHKNATGARVPIDKLNDFRDFFEEEVDKLG